MAETAQELIDNLKKTNEDYHEIIGQLMECEEFTIEQRALIGSGATHIFEFMTKMNDMLSQFLD